MPRAQVLRRLSAGLMVVAVGATAGCVLAPFPEPVAVGPPVVVAPRPVVIWPRPRLHYHRGGYHGRWHHHRGHGHWR
jgi:hypothetical protein